MNLFVEYGDGDPPRFAELFRRWVADVKAPVSVYVASHGILNALPPYLRPLWADWVPGTAS